jgi:hypothetical protein
MKLQFNRLNFASAKQRKCKNINPLVTKWNTTWQRIEVVRAKRVLEISIFI